MTLYSYKTLSHLQYITVQK